MTPAEQMPPGTRVRHHTGREATVVSVYRAGHSYFEYGWWVRIRFEDGEELRTDPTLVEVMP